tara:strand:- start:5217 stop:5522 length:306 start_codon:yes stop_codon:yes gene_type:complete
MKQNLELLLDINIDLDENIEIDETQFSRIVDMIKKIGIEKFQDDNYLSDNTAEGLAYQHCQETIIGHINDMLYTIDDEFVDSQIIDNIQFNYKEELDENKN